MFWPAIGGGMKYVWETGGYSRSSVKRIRLALSVGGEVELLLSQEEDFVLLGGKKD